MEVVEKEEANFDTEISEDDVAGEWKLRGQVLMRSPVRFLKSSQEMWTYTEAILYLKEKRVKFKRKLEMF